MAGADLLANSLLESLTTASEFALPVVDVSGSDYQVPDQSGPAWAPISRLTNADLTTGVVGGAGTFDALMSGFKAHLDGEYKANRITGAEYTKAFIALTESAMGNGVSFLLGRDAAYWQAIAAQSQAQLAQIQVITARVELETAKLKMEQSRLEARNTRAAYALNKMKLATESVQYDAAVFGLEHILPKQELLLSEQIEVQRAQTLDSRTDALPVAGTVGKQKDLYTQQITSYKRDSEVKAAKMFVDAWITQKTIDEGLVPPTSFANASLETVLTALKVNNNLT